MAEGWKVTKKAEQRAVPAEGWRVTRKATEPTAFRGVVEGIRNAAPPPDPTGYRTPGDPNAPTRAPVPGGGRYADPIGMLADAGIGTLTSLGQGATLGAGDEMTGGLAALGTLVATGGDSAAADRAYAGGRDAVRGQARRFETQNPLASGVGNVAGALLTGKVTSPTALGASSPNLLARMGGAAVTGAGVGGVAGFASGEGGFVNRATDATIGALAGGALGLTTEGLATLLQRVARARAQGLDIRILDQTGRATPDARQVAQDLGIDLNTLPKPVLERLDQVTAARALGAADSLPVPVPLTRGQATNNLDDLGEEFALYRGGGPAADRMRNFYADQQEALAANIPALQRRIAGDAPLIERGQGGEMASDRLNALFGEARARKNAFYDEAERLTPPTPLSDRPFGNANTRGAVDPLYGGRRTDADENFELVPRRADFPQSRSQIMMSQAWDAMVREIPLPENAPGVAGVLRRFGSQADENGLPVADIFQMRKLLTNLQKGPPSPESIAARQAKGVIDRHMDEAVRSSLLEGDTEAIQAWQRAITNYRDDYADRFKRADFVGDLVARDGANAGRLVVSPTEATNYIFGQADAGITPRRDLARNLVRLREVLGPDSEAWNAMRQEGFLRIANASLGAQGPNGRAFSGAKLATAWEDFNRKTPELARTLFTETERRDIGNWVNVARKVTTKDGAVYAPSTSPLQMKRLLSAGVLNRLGPIGEWIGRSIGNAVDLNKADRLLSGRVPEASRRGGFEVPAVTYGGAALFNQ